MTENLQHSDNTYHIHNEKDYHPHSDIKIESPKLEDSSSNNSLLIDEQLNRVNDPNQIFLPETTEICNQVCYETQFQCNVCFAVFPNDEVLNTHRKESHGSTGEVKVIPLFCVE